VPPFGALVAHATEAEELGVAILMPADPARPEPGAGWAGAIVRGIGPGGPDLAAQVALLSARWADRGRPGSHDLAILVWPGQSRHTEPPSEAPEGWLVLERPSATIAAGWPVSSP
jgi:hypothetical protein